MRKLLFILFIIPGIVSCKSNGSKKENDSGNRATITVSILPQKYFLEKIAGDRFNINVMIPPGFAPASYDPNPKQMRDLENSTLYLRIGKIIFEQVWMDNIRQNNPHLKIYDLSRGIEFMQSDDHHHHHHGTENEKEEIDTGVDPHIWMSIRNADILAANIFDAMVENYPSDSSDFRKNYEELIKEINSVRQKWDREKEELSGSAFLIYHPALAYLAKEYNMEQMVLEFEGKEPPPAYVREIVDEAQEKDIKFILIQKQFSTDNAKILANEINAEIVQIDPLSEDWPGQMNHILNIFKEKL